MTAPTPKPRRQCKACPWKVTTAPGRDIPGGYSADKHRALTACRSEGFKDFGRATRVMACHEFPPGREQPCVGWVINQLGPGNNISMRLRAMRGDFQGWQVEGEQHESLEDMCAAAGKTR